MDRMIDLLDLVKRYCPEAKVVVKKEDVEEIGYLAADLAVPLRVALMKTPKMGWIIEIEQVMVYFTVPTKDAGLTLARAITNQIEICKARTMEDWEHIQNSVIDQIKEELSTP